MRILYNHRTQARGAEGTHITKIVANLQELGHEVDILSPPGIDPFSQLNSAPVDKSDVRTKGLATVWKSISKFAPEIVFELAEIGYNFSLWIQMNRKLRDNKYDAVFERYAFFMLAGAVLARRHRIPFFLEANELSGVKIRSRSLRLVRLCRYFEKKLLSRCDIIFVVSSTLKKMVEEFGIPNGRIQLLPNAVDKATLVIDQEKLLPIKATYGFDGATVIGCVGWFDKWDRLDFLISVFGKIAAVHSNVRLMLIGDGPSVADAKLQVAGTSLEQKVTFTGAIDKKDVFTYLSLLDIAILPHSNDYGSPVVLFELLGLGIPVVAPALPPIMDIVVHDETALVFEPLNTDDCLKQLERLVSDAELRSRLGGNGRYRIHNEHTWIGNAEKIEQVIRTVL